MQSCLLSIIIPTYNVEKYIGQVIDDIIKQTWKEWELIIVDDGSIDSTVSIVESYESKDNRIKFLQRNRDPKGSVTCRNIGQMAAKGKYFIHFDSDDIIEPFCFEQRVIFMETHPDVEFATFPGESVRQESNGVIKYTGKNVGKKPRMRQFVSILISSLSILRME